MNLWGRHPIWRSCFSIEKSLTMIKNGWLILLRYSGGGSLRAVFWVAGVAAWGDQAQPKEGTMGT